MFKKIKTKKQQRSQRPNQKPPQRQVFPDASAPISNAPGNFSQLRDAIEQGTLADVQGLWAESPTLFQQRTTRQQTVLHLAAKAGDAKKLQFLCSCFESELAQNVDALDDQEKTTLHYAVMGGHRECVEWLMNAGASLTIASDSGQSALHYAAEYPHPGILPLLLEQIPQTERASLLQQRDGTGKTPLHYAAKQENVELVTLLLDNGAPVHLCDNDHNTPLHTAARFGFYHSVIALMAEGAKVNAKNHRGETPYWLALRFGHEVLALWLLNHYPRSPGYEINQVKDKVLRQLFCTGDSLLIREQEEKATEFYQEALSLAEEKQNLLAVIIAKQKLSLAYLAQETLQQLYPELMEELKWMQQGKSKSDVEALLHQTEVLLAKAVALKAFAVQVILLGEQSKLYLKQRQYLPAAYTANAALALYEQQRPLVHMASQGLNADEKMLYEGIAAVESEFLGHMGHRQKTLDINRYVDYRKQVAKIRCEIQQQLSEEHAEPSGSQIAKALNTEYQKLLNSIVTASIEALGTPPCEYSILGLGALARSSMSPYSAFQWGILLKVDNPNNRHYFATLARLVELALINLGETPYIYGRCDYAEMSATANGLRLDATGIAPLGRVDKESWETIGEFKVLGTPQQLAAYQAATSAMPLEERLREALQVACLIQGSTKLLAAYEAEMSKLLDKRKWLAAKKNTPRQAMALANLRFLLNMSQAMVLDEQEDKGKEKEKEIQAPMVFKQEDYRVLERFITTLTQFCQLSARTVWDCLEALEVFHLLNKSQFLLIESALTTLIHLRFRAQLQVGSASDMISFKGAVTETGYSLSPAETEALGNYYRILLALSASIEQLCQSEGMVDFSVTLQSHLHSVELKKRVDNFLTQCADFVRLPAKKRARFIAKSEAYFEKRLTVEENLGEKEEVPPMMSIAYTDLVLGKMIGKGGFGQVFLGTYHEGRVAIKRLMQYQEQGIEQFKQEVKVMSQFRHPNIATLFGACLENIGEYVLVMEYMPGGSLHDLLERHQNQLDWDDDWALRYTITLHILAGLFFLHHEEEGRKQAVIHGDIKSRNVLLGSHGEAKVCDFGTAYIKTREVMEGEGGTFLWMAPEVLEETSKNNVKTDVYSFGMLLYEVVALMTPYANISQQQALLNIMKGERPSTSRRAPKPITQLMHRCWAHNPEERPTMKEARAFLTREKAIKQLRKGGFFAEISAAMNAGERRVEGAQSSGEEKAPRLNSVS